MLREGEELIGGGLPAGRREVLVGGFLLTHPTPGCSPPCSPPHLACSPPASPPHAMHRAITPIHCTQAMALSLGMVWGQFSGLWHIGGQTRQSQRSLWALELGFLQAKFTPLPSSCHRVSTRVVAVGGNRSGLQGRREFLASFVNCKKLRYFLTSRKQLSPPTLEMPQQATTRWLF